MSADRRSSVSSVSLLEIKNETRMVLQAFLQQTISVPLKDRPGRVGGTYKDHKNSKVQRRAKDGWDSQADDISSADEKKTVLKSFIKQLPRHNTSRRSAKSPKGSLDRGSKLRPSSLRDQTGDDAVSPSSASDQEDNEKKQQNKLNKRKIKKKLSRFFKLKLEKEKDRDGSEPNHQRPSTLSLSKKAEPASPVVSPNHPPKFYNEVAEKLKKIAQKSTNTKKSPISQPSVQPVLDKDTVMQQLLQMLTLEGDSINTKIQSDSFLCSSLSQLSYGSFANLLDAFNGSQVSEPQALPPAASPTLQRMAVTMEVSRRILTATGAQHMQGYAECYMETFAPWVKSHGGWENLQAHMEDFMEECD